MPAAAAAVDEDFATAGALELVTRRQLDVSQPPFTAGRFDTLRGFAGRVTWTCPFRSSD